MAIVLDQFDPSGMFSKAGRVSLEMFQIIQQKNEILFNKKKYYHPKLASFGLYDLVNFFLLMIAIIISILNAGLFETKICIR